MFQVLLHHIKTLLKQCRGGYQYHSEYHHFVAHLKHLVKKKTHTFAFHNDPFNAPLYILSTIKISVADIMAVGCYYLNGLSLHRHTGFSPLGEN